MNDNRTLWELDARNVNAQFAEPLNSHRTSLGLPPVDNVRDHVLTDRPWLAADPVLGPWRETPGIDVTQTGAWYLPNEHPLPAALLTFLDAGAPPVYVGFGSLRPSQDIVRKTVEVIRARGQRVLVSRGWAELDLVDDGDDCFAVGEVNHQRLFARVAAVVHHGGAGTTVTAARAGVPQVVVPLQLADNPYWAARWQTWVSVRRSMVRRRPPRLSPSPSGRPCHPGPGRGPGSGRPDPHRRSGGGGGTAARLPPVS